MTSGNTVLRSDMIKYLSNVKVPPTNKKEKVQFPIEKNQNAICTISIMTHKE